MPHSVFVFPAGDGTAHGHGFVALANIYQFSTLEDISAALEGNVHGIPPAEMVKRITSFMTHLHREDHFDDLSHQQNLGTLEQLFHTNNFGPEHCTQHSHLSARPARMHCADAGAGAWQGQEVDQESKRLREDGRRFSAQYEEDCQFIFSRVQHHWHKLDKDGKRQPMRYCQQTGRGKRGCCKRGFPKKVLRDEKGKLKMTKYRYRVVCAGVAIELDLKTSGRRNMVGAVVGRRRCEWFSGTSAILAHLTRSNTNVQCPYRLPINQHTHDPDCTRKSCAKMDPGSCASSRSAQ